MKKLLLYIIGVSMAVASCDIETSDNGQLDGFWQLRTVDTLATNGVKDMRETGLTWSFQHRLLELRDVKGQQRTLYFSFSHSGDALVLTNPYISARDEGDIKVEETDVLKPYGINHLEEHFQVLTLTSSHMVLQTDELRLDFRKY